MRPPKSSADSETPVLVFAYNRPQFLRRCLESLERNAAAAKTLVFVQIDGPRDAGDERLVDACREVCAWDWNFRKLVVNARQTNLGLRASILAGVTEVLKDYSRVIVIEDDLIVTSNFLDFFEEALGVFAPDGRVQAISGFTYFRRRFSRKALFLPMSESWGWATWRSRWQIFEDAQVEHSSSKHFGFLRELVLEAGQFRSLAESQRQGLVDSWAIDWFFSGYERNQVTVYPPYSLVLNEGLRSGTHVLRHERRRRSLTPERFGLDNREILLATNPSPRVLQTLRLAYKLSGSLNGLVIALGKALHSWLKTMPKRPN